MFDRLSISPSDAPLRAASPLGRRGMGEPRREERSPFGRLSFPYLHAPNAESLELARASSNVFQRRVFLKVSAYWRGTFSHECDCRIKLTAPSSASQKPAAFPPALILTAKLPEGFAPLPIGDRLNPFFLELIEH